MYRFDDIDFKSKLDLDYKLFNTKRIYRCEICGNVYYTSSNYFHACYAKKADTTSVDEKVSSINDRDLGDIKNSQALISTPIYFHDEIYAIWKKKGFKRHCKPEIKENTIQQTMQSTDSSQKEKFSFSPYDNFF